METLPFLVLPSVVTDAGPAWLPAHGRPASQRVPTVSLVDRGGGRVWEDGEEDGPVGVERWTVEWSVPRRRRSPPRPRPRRRLLPRLISH